MKHSRRKITFLIFSALCIFSFAFFTVAQENSTSDKNIFLDSDQDGLSDDEEKTYGTDLNNRDTDGDGYSDGAEVKSGYDPTKPAPGDKIISDAKQVTSATGGSASGGDNSQQNSSGENLTQQVSEGVANLITQKEGENQEISLDDLDAIIQKTTSETLTFDDLPAIDEKEIKIKKQNYSSLSDEKRKTKEKDDAIEYLTALSYIFVNNSPQKITSSNDIEILAQNILGEVNNFSTDPTSDISYFEDLAKKGESTLEQIKEVEVPEQFLDIHINGMKLAKYAVSLKDKAKPDPDDPVATITKLSKVQSLLDLSTEFADKVTSKLTGVGISEIPINL